MAINFDALVLAPAMRVFAEPFTVQPIASMGKSAAPYEARGIYSERPIDVQLVDGTVLSSAEKTLGIRLSEFSTPMMQGDRITLRGVVFVIEDTDDDGQGGSVLTLRELRGQ